MTLQEIDKRLDELKAERTRLIKSIDKIPVSVTKWDGGFEYDMVLRGLENVESTIKTNISLRKLLQKLAVIYSLS